jgi:hypothetical protein
MLHVHAAMTAPHDEETGLDDLELMKPGHFKQRGRALSDELSTAAPSPEVSPTFGPQQNSPFTPLSGPGELLLTDFDCTFELPDAQESLSCSDADFELSGFGDDLDIKEFELVGFDDDHKEESDHEQDEDEDIETELLTLLGRLSSLRTESREQFELADNGSGSEMQKIPYPQLEAGFIPSSFMPAKSWLLPAGCAQTGKWAYAMAPRPVNSGGMEPLNIVLGETGVTLEVCSEMPEEVISEAKRKRAAEAKAVFRRRRGRSRSPLVLMEDMVERDVPEGSPRGRPRLWTR